MEKTQKGAWVVHNGRKVQGATNASAHYGALDIASKAASLLSKIASTEQSQVTSSQVSALATSSGLNSRTDLPVCLHQLSEQGLISIGKNNSVESLGITSRSALTHAADLFEHNDPSKFEKASIGLGEIASDKPVKFEKAAEYIADTYKIKSSETAEFLKQAMQIGFVDFEGDVGDRILFNGNLFRKENIAKTKLVLDSLSQNESRLVIEFFEKLKVFGAMQQHDAEHLLGSALASKLRAAGVFDESVIANDMGEHTFVTSPGAFHKFISPMEDDAFDQAKALVSALKYGMSISDDKRGRIFAVTALLRKLIKGESVGPAPAICQDYRALEFEGVVLIEKLGWGCKMSLRKIDVGEIALQVLSGGDASAAIIEKIPGVAASSFKAPEQMRFDFRRKNQTAKSRKQTEELLRAVRGGGGL